MGAKKLKERFIVELIRRGTKTIWELDEEQKCILFVHES